MTSQLDVQTVDVSYGGNQVLNQIDFTVEPGQIGCMLGPSGCGKTTVLRAIAGFEPISRGRILVNHVEFSSPRYCLPTEKRHIGMVFQDFALFPNMSVADNIRFGLRSWNTDQQQARIQELLAMIGMPASGQAYPHQLSGGQQQRVALARAMAPKPGILLLDEPFSSMDVELREQLAREVRNILKQERVTAILVTHDQYEAFAIADKICVINEGRIEQQDTGYNLYHQPGNRFVADFIGQGVIIPAEVVGGFTVKTELGIISSDMLIEVDSGAIVDVLIRPDDVVHDDHSDETAIVVEKAFRGADFLYFLRTDSGTEILCLAPSHHNHRINERIGIRLHVDHLVVFERTQEAYSQC
ncbi:MAG: ABC transporter ATP-binding protein [Gammaproteobacteria bacterium]|nr:ABC transporter ATP-binding protein [Gammaproteobacteria bacterium]